MKKNITQLLEQSASHGKKHFAVLIDPDSVQGDHELAKICRLSDEAGVDFILVGGSLITNGFWNDCVKLIKQSTRIPVVLFPGNVMQIHPDADAILFLSMISGRNADLLIGKHVLAAPDLKRSGIEVIPAGYMIVDGGNITSVMYMSNTMPIPSDKYNIAAATALAGEMLGLKVLYMDAGSGAKQPIPAAMIAEVKKSCGLPLFAGGGIRTPEQAIAACRAGADVIVVGNAIEKDEKLIHTLAAAVHGCNLSLSAS